MEVVQIIILGVVIAPGGSYNRCFKTCKSEEFYIKTTNVQLDNGSLVKIHKQLFMLKSEAKK